MGALHWSVSLGEVYEIESYQPRKGVGHLLSRVRAEMLAALDKAFEADAELASGKTIPEVSKAPGIAETTYHRWRSQYGGIKADEMKRLKDLEKENARLKALVADLSLDRAILQEAARGNS